MHHVLICSGSMLLDNLYSDVAILIVLTHVDGDWQQLSLPNKIAYAHNHDYKLRVYGHLDKGLAPSWSKTLALQSILQEYSFVWSIDL